MNHATIAAIECLTGKTNRSCWESDHPRAHKNACNGEQADLLLMSGLNKFCRWDAYHITQSEAERTKQHAEDAHKLACQTLNNIDCPLCRKAIDAAFEGIDLGPQMRGEVK